MVVRANILKVVVVAGARPNFVKVAPILKVMHARKGSFNPVFVHTGQHYDDKMSSAFLRELKMGEADYYLGVGSGTHAEQTAKVMVALEQVLDLERPDWVVVVGDVNSTLAAAITAVKKGIRTAHVEAGLRSFDRTMPEEINRVVTDSVCDLLLTPSGDADENLRREGIEERRIVCVGNVMIDTLLAHLSKAHALKAWKDVGLKEPGYILVTLHRPSNVDDLPTLTRIVCSLADLAKDTPVIFPVHPRTATKLKSVPKAGSVGGLLHLCTPLSYLSFVSILSAASLVLTDSGGVQEEASFLGVPCLTFRTTTERPVTVLRGTNKVIGSNPECIAPMIRDCLNAASRRPCSIPLWDGHTAERIADTLLRWN